MADKEKLRELFQKDWEKHYKVKALTEKGFVRKKCRNCGNHFWTLDSERELCADASCVGYDFIGRPTKRFDYVQTWKEVEKYFTKRGHTSISRFPTVCRWRDDLYFTNASIIDFQPYVVSGEVMPPANPLIVPQASIRFVDIGNVGVTGRHYTSFIMFGQHAFNTKQTGMFYWKDECLNYDYDFITSVLGAKKEEVVFQEEVWAGGGTFGPCIEYCVNGVELGNAVFMQYKEVPGGGYSELDTKVIDMGAGLERFAWFTNGSPTSYEITFGPVADYLKKELGVKVEEKLFTNYAKLSGLLDVESQKLKQHRIQVAKKLGVSEEELFGKLAKLQALYSIADHLKTILYTSTDGMLPSNSGGGYNLRLLLRRVFGFEEEFKWEFDCAKAIQLHAEHLRELDSSLLAGVETAISVVEEERKKYNALRETSKRKLVVVVEKLKKEKREFSEKEMIQLYESDGIPLEIMKEVAEKEKIKAKFPENFYGIIAKKNEKNKEEEEKKSILSSEYPKTDLLFYKDSKIKEFEGKVIGIEDPYLILDRTAFYPEGGGQAADYGEINNVKVKYAIKQDGVVLHEMEGTKHFKKGMTVIGKINWERRANLMRNHTATHLLNAAARETLGQHIWQAGAEKEEFKAHLDLTHYKKITPEELRTIEAKVNSWIQQNLEVKKEVLERNKAEEKYGFRIYQGGFVPGKELRIINILGVDVEACGGTHVDRTGEIGFFKIMKKESIQDGIERVFFVSGMPAVRFMQEKEELLRKTAEELNVPEADLLKGTQKMLAEWKALRKGHEERRAKTVGELWKELAHEKGDLAKRFIAGAEEKVLLDLAKRIIGEEPSKAVVLASEKEVLIMCGEKSKRNAKEILERIMSEINVSGGGSQRVARGRIISGKAEDVLKELK